MTQIFKVLLAGLVFASSAIKPVAAQTVCPGGEGRTASGQCVNPLLSSSLRMRGIILSQQRISETAYPILPSADRVYPRPGEFNRFELSGVPRSLTSPTPGIFGSSSFYPSCHPNC